MFALYCNGFGFGIMENRQEVSFIHVDDKVIRTFYLGSFKIIFKFGLMPIAKCASCKGNTIQFSSF